MEKAHVAWMECKPAEKTFVVKFGSRKEGRQFAERIGAEIIEWRRGA